MENILKQRAAILKREGPEGRYDCFLASSEVGDWGYIAIMDKSGKITSYEFLESVGSWERSEAFRLHEKFREQGFNVRILVPNIVFKDAGTKAFLQGTMNKVDMDTLEDSGVVLESVPPHPFDPEEYTRLREKTKI